METIKDRFLRYVKVHTTSDATSPTVPSTVIQFDLARMLEEELKHLGITEVVLDDKCLLTAKIPSNMEVDVPAVGFFAHVDTSPETSGENVEPMIWENYDGKNIVLNEDIILSPDVFPTMKQYVGKTIITADGTTLLGADDKSAIASLMYVAEYLMSHPEIEHGDIWFAFTPDEEIGLRVSETDIERIKADFGYTLDGESPGEIQNETFNAASLTVKVKGRQVHPSTAKGTMINALQVIQEYNAALPKMERPESTEGREGFYHLVALNGSVEAATAQYIIREHATPIFEQRKAYAKKIGEELQAQYPEATITTDISDTYYNLGDSLVEYPEVVAYAREAMEDLGLEVNIFPFRGGTDGSVFSRRGIPTPNIFAGWHNAHGKYEYTTVETMELASEVVLGIIDKVKKCNQ